MGIANGMGIDYGSGGWAESKWPKGEIIGTAMKNKKKRKVGKIPK